MMKLKEALNHEKIEKRFFCVWTDHRCDFCKNLNFKYSNPKF